MGSDVGSILSTMSKQRDSTILYAFLVCEKIISSKDPVHPNDVVSILQLVRNYIHSNFSALKELFLDYYDHFTSNS